MVCRQVGGRAGVIDGQLWVVVLKWLEGRCGRWAGVAGGCVWKEDIYVVRGQAWWEGMYGRCRCLWARVTVMGYKLAFN